MAKRKATVKISSGAMHARAKFEEAKHKRDSGGKFADKPGASNTAQGGPGGPGSAGASKGAWTAAAKSSGVTGSDKIRLHVTANPKKAGSASAERFAKYKDGMTVDEYIAAGGTREDLAWDRKKGFMTLHDEPTYAKLSGQAGSATSEIAEGATGRLAAIKQSVEAPPQNLKEATASPGTPPRPAAPADTKPAPKPEPPAPKTEASDDFHDDDIIDAFGQKMRVAQWKSSFNIPDAQVQPQLQSMVAQGKFKITKAAPKLPENVSVEQGGTNWKTAPGVQKSLATAKQGAVGAEIGTSSDAVKKGDVQYEEMKAASDSMGLQYVSRDSNAAVKGYVRNSNAPIINTTLRKVGYDGLGSTNQKTTDGLDKLMAETKGDAIMWRGIRNDSLNNMPPPNEFADMGFVSMSHNPKHSLSLFAGNETISGTKSSVLFKVRVPAGTKAASVGAPKTADDGLLDEAEVLLARGSRFKYVNSSFESVGGQSVKIIEVEVVQNSGAKIATQTKPFTADGKEFGGFGSGKIPKGVADESFPNPLYKEGNGWVTGPTAIKDAGKGKLEMMTETVDVPVKKLEAWQGAVNKTTNFKPLPPDGEYPPIEVYKVGGKYIVKEGNHRSVAAYIEGRETIKAKVLDLDAPENKKYINTKYADKIAGGGEVRPMKAAEGEKITDEHITVAKPATKVELHKKMPNDYRYKATELNPLPSSSMADEADAGLKWEYEVEYLKYGGKSWGPGINSQEDFNKRYKAAPLTYLNDDEYNNLGYTSVNMNHLPTYNDVHKQIGHRRDPKAIQDRMFNGVTTPPIVLRKNGKLRLMAGQSRIFTGFASGFRVPVKVLDV